MSVRKAFVTIAVSGVILGSVGCAIGSALGRFAPSYYRAVFEIGDSPDFEPVQIGFGLGLTQGLMTGLILGGVAVLAVSVSDALRTRKGRTLRDDEVGGTRGNGCLVLAAGLLLGSVISLPIGVIVGEIRGAIGCQNRRHSQEKALIEPVLAGDPSTSNLRFETEDWHDAAWLEGELATDEDLIRLRSRLTTLLGESRAKEILSEVTVKTK